MKKGKITALLLAIGILATACGNTAQTETESDEIEAVSIETSTEAVEVIETEEAETVETETVETDTAEEAETVETETEEASDDTTEESEQESAGVEIIEELDLTMYATVNCNARTGDGTNYDKAAFIELGAELHVTGKTANSWYRVVWSGAENNSVYILGDYLSTVNPYASTATATETSTTAETSAAAGTSTTTETSTTAETSTTSESSSSTSSSTSSASSSSSSTSSARYDTVEEYYNWVASTCPTWDEETIKETAEFYYNADHNKAKW